MSRNAPKRKPNESVRHEPDKTLLTFGILMALFGIIMIFDASVYQANQFFNDQYYFLKLQLLWIVLGLIPALIVYYIDYKKLLKFSGLALGVGLFLLIAVLVAGNEVNGA